MGGSGLTHIYPIKIHLCIALDDIFFLHKFLISHQESDPHSSPSTLHQSHHIPPRYFHHLDDSTAFRPFSLPFLSISNGYQLFTVPQPPSLPPQVPSLRHHPSLLTLPQAYHLHLRQHRHFSLPLYLLPNNHHRLLRLPHDLHYSLHFQNRLP